MSVTLNNVIFFRMSLLIIDAKLLWNFPAIFGHDVVFCFILHRVNYCTNCKWI